MRPRRRRGHPGGRAGRGPVNCPESQLTVDDVDFDGDTVSITFGTSPVVLPAPLATLVRELVATRRGKAKICTPDDVPWLVPRGHPGRPLGDDRIGQRLHKVGIRPKQDRSTALFTLATECRRDPRPDARGPHQSGRPVATGIRRGLGRLRCRRQPPVEHRTNTRRKSPVSTSSSCASSATCCHPQPVETDSPPHPTLGETSSADLRRHDRVGRSRARHPG